MNDNRVCQTCHWSYSAFGAWLEDESPWVECRRSPPQGKRDENGNSSFPTLRADDWCGEFLAKKEPLMRKTPDLNVSICELDLSVRASNALESAGITTIGKLVRYTRQDLLNTQYIGKTSLKEIVAQLKQRGLSIGMEGEPA